MTYRRLAEALGQSDLAAFRNLLADQRPQHGAGLLWALTPE
ncbi:hypothetical protein J2S43_002632 [Catenuloplanes nepalensis]|uniref:Uncharacterized protein n=1 Tax=Catenuloplanes nepalensis TaxID=587533 RepID=A0ABT9MRQ3_9ACTN|nr:hypothetical protein [Catenuloplanes nepalensis]MDP9794120.1 hypothetical protein [Catenuloplanes nepalensis]